MQKNGATNIKFNVTGKLCKTEQAVQKKQCNKYQISSKKSATKIKFNVTGKLCKTEQTVQKDGATNIKCKCDRRWGR